MSECHSTAAIRAVTNCRPDHERVVGDRSLDCARARFGCPDLRKPVFAVKRPSGSPESPRTWNTLHDCPYPHRRRRAGQHQAAPGQARGGVLPGRDGAGRVRGAAAGAFLAARPDPAGRDDARHGRLPDLPPAEGRQHDDAYPRRDGDGAGRPDGAAARAGGGGGRLPHQAARIRHAARPRARPGAAEAAAGRVAGARRDGAGARPVERPAHRVLRRRRAGAGRRRLGPRRAERAGGAVPRRHHSRPRPVRERGAGHVGQHQLRPDRAQPVHRRGRPAAPGLPPAGGAGDDGDSPAADRRAGAARPAAARFRPGRQRLGAAPGGRERVAGAGAQPDPAQVLPGPPARRPWPGAGTGADRPADRAVQPPLPDAPPGRAARRRAAGRDRR